MNESNLKKKIICSCVDCIAAWKRDNWEQPIDIHYDDYVNTCYNYGGSELSSLIDELVSGSSDENLQDFYGEVSFACECENRGIRSAIGKRIKSFRLQLGMTQQDLADTAGITKANVCNIEAGKYSVGLDVLNKIVNALGVKVELK